MTNVYEQFLTEPPVEEQPPQNVYAQFLTPAAAQLPSNTLPRISSADVKPDANLVSGNYGGKNTKIAADAPDLSEMAGDAASELKAAPGRVSDALGTGLNYAGNVTKAVPADIAETLYGDEKYWNLKNLAGAALGEKPEITEKIKSASDEHPVAALSAKISQGLAASAPIMAVGMPEGVLGRLVSAGFSAQMIAGANEASKVLGTEMGKNPEDRDKDAMTTAVSDLIQSGAFAPLAAMHAGKPSAKYAATEALVRSLMNEPKAKPMVQGEAPPPAIIEQGKPISQPEVEAQKKAPAAASETSAPEPTAAVPPPESTPDKAGDELEKFNSMLDYFAKSGKPNKGDLRGLVFAGKQAGLSEADVISQLEERAKKSTPPQPPIQPALPPVASAAPTPAIHTEVATGEIKPTAAEQLFDVPKSKPVEAQIIQLRRMLDVAIERGDDGRAKQITQQITYKQKQQILKQHLTENPPVPQAQNDGLIFTKKQSDGYLVGFKMPDGTTRKTELYPTEQEAKKAIQSLLRTGEHPPIDKPAPQAQIEKETLNESDITTEPSGVKPADREPTPVESQPTGAGGGRVVGGEQPSASEEVAGGREPRPAGAGSRPAGAAGAGEGDGERGQPPSPARNQRDLRGAVTEPGRVTGKNYVITDKDRIGQGSIATKKADNMAAIRLVKQLESENRTATTAEQAVLARYVGWGGLKGAFVEGNKAFAGEFDELKKILTPEEYEGALASIQDAHYTSPTVIQRGIYAAMKRFGFTGGKMVEGGVGIGNFIGMMPDEMRANSSYVGVERDPLTAKIAKYLYPEANILPMGYQEAKLTKNHFDGAVGNPPFGNKAIYDKNHPESSKFTIHNYFIAKTLELMRPGATGSFVVSRYFLDTSDKAAREHIAKQAEFLGAIRLPNTAFKENANTEVVTDLVFFKKRPVPLKSAEGEDWTKVVDFHDPESGLTWPVNKWVAEHPEMVLGKITKASHGLYGKEEMTVEPTSADLGKSLDTAVANLPENVYENYTREDVDRLNSAPDEKIPEGAKPGGFFVDENGALRKRLENVNEKPVSTPVEMKPATAERVKAMIPVRDTYNRQIKLEMTPDAPEKLVEENRKKLNAQYDAFVKRYGFLNSPTNRRAFFDDNDVFRLLGLETDYSSGVSAETAKKHGVEPMKPGAKKADIFTKRVNSPYQEVSSVETPKEALTVSLNQRGEVNLDYMAGITGFSKDQILKDLGGLVFKTPEGGYQSKEQYLSGNVREKLAEAQAAGAGYESNAEELKKVIPKDIDPTDIKAPVGAPWVSPADISRFVEELTESAPSSIAYLKSNGGWLFEHRDRSLKSTEEYGTKNLPFGEIFKAMLNGKQIVDYDFVSDGNGGEQRIVNQERTELALSKAEIIKQKWDDWLWKDEERRNRLHRVYNDNFNNYVDYVADGSHLTLPSSSPDVSLRMHQKNVVWRMITNGGEGLLLDHVVGAGKTYAGIGGMMELKRLGRVRKWLVPVPNHLTGQWADAFSKMYPNARVLAAKNSDFSKANRNKLFAKILSGNFDAVIIGHSSLKKIGTSPEVERGILNEMLQEIVDTIKDMRAAEKGRKGGSRAVAQMEKTKDNIKAKIDRLADISGRDKTATFDELGFDGLFLDEAHEFKNLFYTTQMQNVSGLGNPVGSAKAFDLYLKIRYLKQQYGGKAPVVFATGTPISNSLVEMFTMQRYLQPEVLSKMSLKTLDAWARVFADIGQVYEVDPTGTGMRMATRMKNFQNVGELTGIYKNMADVISMNDLQAQAAMQGRRFPVPKVDGGKPDNLVSERTPEQAAFFGVEQPVLNGDGTPALDSDGNPRYEYPKGTILWRVDNMPKDPSEDNMLKLTNDARKAGLDMRLIDPSAPDRPQSKINKAVEQIAQIHKDWESQKGTQLVFCDLSTPKSAKGKATAKAKEIAAKGEEGDTVVEPLEQEASDAGVEPGETAVSVDDLLADESDFSVYDDMKAKLIKKGIPEKEIAFIHDYDTPEKKMKLFKQVRAGDIRVLFGSTSKMGAGMNVQDRIVALHHMDAPWRPSDLEQREGRAIRQGNLFYEEAMKKYKTPQDYDKDPSSFAVKIKRYATNLTYDTRMWQLIEHKATSIEGFRRADRNTRSIEDVGGEATNASDMKAAASGDPMIAQEIKLRTERKKLELLKNAYRKNLIGLQGEASWLSKYEQRFHSSVESADKMIQQRDANTKLDDKGKVVFDFTLPSGKNTAEKGVPVNEMVEAIKKGGVSGVLGKYRGWIFTWNTRTWADGSKSVEIGRQGTNAPVTTFTSGEQIGGVGLFQRLDNWLASFEGEKEAAGIKRDREAKQLVETEQQMKKGFPKDAELAELTKQHSLVQTALMDKKRKRPVAPPKQDLGPSMGAVTPSDPNEPVGKSLPEQTAGYGGDIYGIARRVRSARAAAGQVAPTEAGEGISAKEAVQWGQDLISMGADADATLREFERTHAISFDIISLARARGEQLAKAASNIEQKFGTDSHEYQIAKRALSEWDARTKPMQTVWHKSGMAQQGETDIDTGTFTGLERAVRWATGKDFTPSEAVKAKAIAKKSNAADDATEKAKLKLDDAIENLDERGMPMQSDYILKLAEKIVGKLDARAEASRKALAAMGTRFNTGIDPTIIGHLANIGASHIAHWGLDFAKWSDAMIKDVGPKIQPHLKMIFSESQKLVDSEAAAHGKDSETVKKVVRRERAAAPPEDLDTQRKAFSTFESGKPMTPAQVKVLWKRAKTEYINKGASDQIETVGKLSTDLGIPVKDILKGLSQNQKIRRVADDVWQKQRQARLLKQAAKRWVENTQESWLSKSLPLAVRVMFSLKTGLHGTVALGTHAAPVLATNPIIFKNNFGKMYKLVASPDYYTMQQIALSRRGNYNVAQRAGLVNDMSKMEDFNDPALAAGFPKMAAWFKEKLGRFGRLQGMGTRGYAVLKILRQDLFDNHWDKLAESEKTPEMAKAIADSVNHITGVVKVGSHPAANVALFAPKLLLSRLSVMIGDPYRALNSAMRLSEMSPEQKWFATNQIREKAKIIAVATSLLLANQTLNNIFGDKKKINGIPEFLGGGGWNPMQSDFMKFKAGGMTFAWGSPFFTMARLPMRLIQIGMGDGGKAKYIIYPDESMSHEVFGYARTQASPFISPIITLVTKADYQGRPLPKIPGYGKPAPVPKRLREQGIKPYTWPEFAAQTALPIPFQEAAKEVWHYGFGLNEKQQESYLKSFVIIMLMAGTGGRLAEDWNKNKPAGSAGGYENLLSVPVK